MLIIFVIQQRFYLEDDDLSVIEVCYQLEGWGHTCITNSDDTFPCVEAIGISEIGKYSYYMNLEFLYKTNQRTWWRLRCVDHITITIPQTLTYALQGKNIDFELINWKVV